MISRRKIIGLIAASAFVAPSAHAVAEDHPSIAFMDNVGKELLHAHRQGTVSAFLRVIQRYADIPGISQMSLGSYQLPAGQTDRYRRGVATFISRYFAEQGRNFPVAKYEVGEATVDSEKNVLVDTKVYMMAGQVYTVSWKLSWMGGTYKVTDAKFLGFSMTSQERSLFTSYIAKHDGDVGALVVALNR